MHFCAFLTISAYLSLFPSLTGVAKFPTPLNKNKNAKETVQKDIFPFLPYILIPIDSAYIGVVSAYFDVNSAYLLIVRCLVINVKKQYFFFNHLFK